MTFHIIRLYTVTWILQQWVTVADCDRHQPGVYEVQLPTSVRGYIFLVTKLIFSKPRYQDVIWHYT